MILQYLNVGHKICMLNEKNDDDKNRKLEENNLNKEKNLDKKRKNMEN